MGVGVAWCLRWNIRHDAVNLYLPIVCDKIRPGSGAYKESMGHVQYPAVSIIKHA
jgi:hypothetical protein